MDFFGKYTTYSSQETQELGGKFGNYLKQVTDEDTDIQNFRSLNICFFGELGSGKTTFIQGCVRAFGITQRLLSPTFIIVRRYEINNIFHYLYHIDLYRLESTNINNIGLDEILMSNHNLTFIEWADKLGPLVPRNRIEIYCKANLENSHEYHIKKSYV